MQKHLFILTIALASFLSCTKNGDDGNDCSNYGGITTNVNVLFWTKLNPGTGISIEVSDASDNFIVSPANNIIKNASSTAPDCINDDAPRYAYFRAQREVKYNYTAKGNGRTWTGSVNINLCYEGSCNKIELK